MSKRSKACEINQRVRAEVYMRDKCCIICGSTSKLTIDHFISRAKSGMGLRENLVILCILCHQEMDNGKNSHEKKAKVKEYLDNHYTNCTDERRKYNKGRRK